MTHLIIHNYIQNSIQELLDLVYCKISSLREAIALHRIRQSTIKELSKLSDKELKDIGISRGDIYYVAYSTTSTKQRKTYD